MIDADGLALMLWIAVFGLVTLFAALAVEALLGRTDRNWIRRLRALERGRAAQRSER